LAGHGIELKKQIRPAEILAVTVKLVINKELDIFLPDQPVMTAANMSSDNVQNDGSELDEIPKQNVQLLLDTIEGINQTQEFKSVLTQSMEATRLIMDSEASSLILMEKSSGDLFISMPTGPAKKEIAGKSIPKNRGISGWVAENKRPYLTNNPAESEYFYGELAEGFTTRNIICVPLINRNNEVIGVLQALNRRSGAEFNSRDIPIFQALASHITVAIERSRAVDRLHDRLKEKDALITEIHHRIKNNLQVLAALIGEELEHMKDDKAKTVLKDISVRVESMSRLHGMLTEKSLSSTVELGSYLGQLSEKIEQTMSSFLYDIKIRLQSEPVEVRQEQALLCGLILNELLINIYKHAFRKDDESGLIEISIHSADDRVFLGVSDNGVGLPEDFSPDRKGSLGMWIVEELMKKLKGEIEIDTRSGTRFEITFPR
jgi:two-component sensor histidine kinase